MAVRHVGCLPETPLRKGGGVKERGLPDVNFKFESPYAGCSLPVAGGLPSKLLQRPRVEPSFTKPMQNSDCCVSSN
jgi:hypothetical protein